jgi:hypothetical protein
MATWCFKTAALNTRRSSDYFWYWQVDTAHTLLLTALKLFPTLEECVADACRNGFRGTVQMTEGLGHPAIIKWADEVDGAGAAGVGSTREAA